MTLFILGLGLILLPILFRLALKLRLGIPMLYAVLLTDPSTTDWTVVDIKISTGNMMIS